jgi:hypothetical protein
MAPGELDLDSVCKQPADKHCNLDQGQIKIKKNFRLKKDTWAPLAHKQLNEHAQFGHEYVNPTYVGQAH